MRVFSSIETVLHSYVNWTVKVRGSHSLGVSLPTSCELYVHPVWGFLQHLHGQTGLHVQSVMLRFRASFSKSSQMRYITNSKNELALGSGQLVIHPVPFSTRSIPMVILAQDPLKPVEGQPWNGLSFDHRKVRLSKSGGPLNTLGSQRQKIFSAELVILLGQIPYLCWILVCDTGYTD